jgi:hypothetical protein
MKYLYLVFAVMFLLFAIVQLNDPDPYIWFPLYAYGSVVSLLLYFKKLNNIILPLIAFVIYIINAIIWWPQTFKGMENTMTIMKPEIEQARETGGMLISAAIMLGYIVVIYRNNKKITY